MGEVIPIRKEAKKLLRVWLPLRIYKEVKDAILHSGRTIESGIKLGFGLLMVALDVEQQGHRLIRVDKNGKQVSEVSLDQK